VLDDLFAPQPTWQRATRGLTIPASVSVHIFFAWWLLQPHPDGAANEETWVEMEFVEPPPPPEPPPVVEEAPKPKPKPEPVAVQTIVETPEPEPPKPVRRVQGLSASSFARGSGTGITVRAGTTTATHATEELMGIDDSTNFDPLPIAAVSRLPRLRYKPPVNVPEEAIAAGAEGRLDLLLDLDTKGRVIKVTSKGTLGFGLDEACADAARRMRYAPAVLNGEAVPVTGVRFPCVIKALD
jgi:protein TonB